MASSVLKVENRQCALAELEPSLEHGETEMKGVFTSISENSEELDEKSQSDTQYSVENNKLTLKENPQCKDEKKIKAAVELKKSDVNEGQAADAEVTRNSQSPDKTPVEGGMGAAESSFTSQDNASMFKMFPNLAEDLRILQDPVHTNKFRE